MLRQSALRVPVPRPARPRPRPRVRQEQRSQGADSPQKWEGSPQQEREETNEQVRSVLFFNVNDFSVEK